MFLSTKIKGNYQLQGNVQVYNARIPTKADHLFDPLIKECPLVSQKLAQWGLLSVFLGTSRRIPKREAGHEEVKWLWVQKNMGAPQK